MGKPEVTNDLRRLRFEHDEMTQQALGVQVGVSRQTIIAIERGKYSPSLALAMRIARFFELSVEEIFSLEE